MVAARHPLSFARIYRLLLLGMGMFNDRASISDEKALKVRAPQRNGEASTPMVVQGGVDWTISNWAS